MKKSLYNGKMCENLGTQNVHVNYISKDIQKQKENS